MTSVADRIFRLARVLALSPREWRYRALAHRSGLFDPVFYRGAYPGMNAVYRMLPLHHFIAYGEAQGYRPNPEFSPAAYLRHNPDVAASGVAPFRHYLRNGRTEGRLTQDLPGLHLPEIEVPVLRPVPRTAPQAIVAHIFYPDLWDEFADTFRALDMPFDLFVTLTWRGEETEELARRIREDFPQATILPMPNQGRDILPFLRLVNAGMLDGYRAVCKIHTKKSPHRQDGDVWRRHLIEGILPPHGAQARLDDFLADPEAAFWVADGQHFTGEVWWGSNFERVRDILARVEAVPLREALSFPAGSMYWMTPLMVGMIKALKLQDTDFEQEAGQVDGTVAHAVERALGYLATMAGQAVRQTSEIEPRGPKASAPPAFVSAFYLPQFHPVPQNDTWWGAGFTEWRSTVNAKAQFAGHLQPMLPADLGYYDLRVTETMGAQAALARDAGIDAFCVYHYWFDDARILEAPMERLLERPDVDMPFYLCWANESWRRNWDGLSGEVLLEQAYREGFEARLAADVARFMRDARHVRPDGQRPRFVIYRPDDLPDPVGSVARLRDAWRAMGLEVELGAVRFHVEGEHPVPADLFDFWIEMPPHGLVTPDDYLFGGPQGNRMPVGVSGRFRGLIYDYAAVAEKADGQGLPDNTIAGIMPSWDNTARRGAKGHMAWGGTPAAFDLWLRRVLERRVPTSYRNELFINAWNEWGEKAVMEPSQTFGRLYLDVLAKHVRGRA